MKSSHPVLQTSVSLSFIYFIADTRYSLTKIAFVYLPSKRIFSKRRKIRRCPNRSFRLGQCPKFSYFFVMAPHRFSCCRNRIFIQKLLLSFYLTFSILLLSIINLKNCYRYCYRFSNFDKEIEVQNRLI